jgi:hypothetical protein
MPKERAGRVVTNPALTTAHEGVTSGEARSEDVCQCLLRAAFKKDKNAEISSKGAPPKDLVDKFPRMSATTGQENILAPSYLRLGSGRTHPVPFS